MLFMQEYAPFPRCAQTSFRIKPILAVHFTYVLLTINRLMREASIRSRKAGEKGISARNIRRVTEVNILVPIFRCPGATGNDTDSRFIE